MKNQKSCRVVVINPVTKTVNTAEIANQNVLESWYDLISNGCRIVTSAMTIHDPMNKVDNSLLMDDEILLRFDDIRGAWKLANSPQVFFNTAVFAGCDEEGENCDSTMDADRLAANIVWLDREQALVEAAKIMLEPIKIISF